MGAKRPIFLLWGLIIGGLFLGGCLGQPEIPTPALLLPADTPVLFTLTPTASDNDLESLEEQQPGTTVPINEIGNTPTYTPPPPAVGTGVRPGQVEQLRPAAAGPATPEDWRPPPVAVPYSLHPDDHYWLIRPIPSDHRNFPLEWYLYGSEPTVDFALPYRVHHGLDFPNETGTPIFAAAGGEVIWAGPLYSNRDGVNYYGNTVIIHHDWQWLGEDVYTLYAHTLELFVDVGDRVEQGQLIAGVGASGEVSGPHLHLEVRVGGNYYNDVRNPLLWVAPFEGWGTLAGRVEDRRGRKITAAWVTVTPQNVSTTERVVRTYYDTSQTPSDEIWDENFVVGDLPAGRYTITVQAGGRYYRRTVEVQPGITNFVVFQADFTFAPTLTPAPTPTPTPGPSATPTEAVEG
ncbi:MAG: peptidoglycan DD-metalloendopeptidase family protein [Candidatus Promineifilaceae bacterium]